MSSAREIREVARSATVVGTTIFAGYLLALLVLRTQVQILLALLLSAGVALALVPRRRWPRVLAFVFLFGGVFGLGSILATAARSFLDAVPLAPTLGQLSTLALLSCLFLAVWVGWWLRDKRRAR
jgi:hypothetical protein